MGRKELKMSSLTSVDKMYLEIILEMGGGYVLDFSDATFEEFFRDHGIDIYGEENYSKNGQSKANRLRAFWEQDSDTIVASVVCELLDMYEVACELSGREPNASVLQKCRSIVDRLTGISHSVELGTVDNFLEKRIEIPSLQNLPVESQVIGIIEERLWDAKLVSEAGAHLSAIFLYGSVLEAVLLGAATNCPEQFNRSVCSPKTADGKVKKFHEWSLAELINVACDIELLEPDIKEFGHGLRSFRNYIHPYEQLSSGFKPDEYTASLCFQVLKAALASVAGER